MALAATTNSEMTVITAWIRSNFSLFIIKEKCLRCRSFCFFIIGCVFVDCDKCKWMVKDRGIKRRVVVSNCPISCSNLSANVDNQLVVDMMLYRPMKGVMKKIWGEAFSSFLHKCKKNVFIGKNRWNHALYISFIAYSIALDFLTEKKRMKRWRKKTRRSGTDIRRVGINISWFL